MDTQNSNEDSTQSETTIKDINEILKNISYKFSLDDDIQGAQGAQGSHGPTGSNITINSGGSGYYTGASYNYNPYQYSQYSVGTLTGSNNPSLKVTGDAEFEKDVKIKGVSIMETLEKINQRLGILVPDPEKLKHFEALQKAYAHYKTLEALCELPKPEEEQ